MGTYIGTGVHRRAVCVIQNYNNKLIYFFLHKGIYAPTLDLNKDRDSRYQLW